jgi:hypothetical protein
MCITACYTSREKGDGSLAGSLYDHTLAIVLIGAIFMAAIAVLPKFGYVSVLSVDQQQLRNVALSALDTMLLDVGYPYNWAQGVSFNVDSVKRFGLASVGTSTMHVLDPDKVTRLVKTDEWGKPNPLGYLPAEKARILLGMQDYGFNLTIMAPFKVITKDLALPADPLNPTDSEMKNISYEVTVALNDGRPVPNAQVYAFIVYSEKVGSTTTDEQYVTNIIKEQRVTDAVGKCKITKQVTGQISDVVTLLKVTVANVSTVTSVYRRGGPRNEIAEINVVGDDIIMTTPPATPRDDRGILTGHVLTEDDVISLFTGTKIDDINWGSADRWARNVPGLAHLNPLMLIFSFRAVEKNSGRQGVLVVGPYPGYLGSRLLSYSCGNPRAESVTLQRSVIISGMTYAVEFTLWKER